MRLYYDEECLGEVMTNHSMTVDEMLNFLEIDMDAYAAKKGWDDWEWEKLYVWA